MNTLAFIAVGVLFGYLVWRGSGKIWNAVLAALCLPIIGIIIFGSTIGRETLELMSWPLVLAGAIGALLIVAFLYRK